ncbi:response regulator transcription factor [Lentzea sp. PSKA42]|uniref:Response regulator transcription factor n=1 Tax=Lentzea indica TaxID=2604800 RepID=A0ABX1FGA7_9PSEU|nr:response regulator transcription factor [Lentzea indica]
MSRRTWPSRRSRGGLGRSAGAGSATGHLAVGDRALCGWLAVSRHRPLGRREGGVRVAGRGTRRVRALGAYRWLGVHRLPPRREGSHGGTAGRRGPHAPADRLPARSHQPPADGTCGRRRTTPRHRAGREDLQRDGRHRRRCPLLRQASLVARCRPARPRERRCRSRTRCGSGRRGRCRRGAAAEAAPGRPPGQSRARRRHRAPDRGGRRLPRRGTTARAGPGVRGGSGPAGQGGRAGIGSCPVDRRGVGLPRTRCRVGCSPCRRSAETAGSAARPRAIRRRPATGWEALTPTEERVAELVTEGLSNPDIAAEMFLSRRTVQTHVSNALAKLGVASRTEIAREAARRNPR